MLQARGLSLRAGERWLVQRLDWHIKPGQFWCVLGRNGAGKTTLLYTMAGLRLPDIGELELHAQPLAAIHAEPLARMRGLMPQSQVDGFADSVFNAVAIARMPHRVGAGWESREDIDVVRSALTQVGLAHRMGDDTNRLSGGERQRVALAALIAQSPELMLLDEPIAHQDIGWQIEVMRLLKTLSSRHAVIASCHDINQAARFASHALVMGERRHWLGPVDQVLTTAVLSEAFDCDIRSSAQGWMAH